MESEKLFKHPLFIATVPIVLAAIGFLLKQRYFSTNKIEDLLSTSVQQIQTGTGDNVVDKKIVSSVINSVNQKVVGSQNVQQMANSPNGVQVINTPSAFHWPPFIEEFRRGELFVTQFNFGIMTEGIWDSSSPARVILELSPYKRLDFVSGLASPMVEGGDNPENGKVDYSFTPRKSLPLILEVASETKLKIHKICLQPVLPPEGSKTEMVCTAS